MMRWGRPSSVNFASLAGKIVIVIFGIVPV